MSASPEPPPARLAGTPSALSEPPFLEGRPRDPALDALVGQFMSGDYRAVRQNAARVAAETTDPRVKRLAEDLRRRIEPDPLMKFLWALAAALLLVLTLYYYLPWTAH